jgi:putative nucleotidyltransferase with HDIG domain
VGLRYEFRPFGDRLDTIFLRIGMSSTNAVLDDLVSGWIGSPPIVFNKLQEALHDPDLSFKDFDAIISADPSLMARLLKVANSSFYGLDTKVETITHALGVVGVKPLIEMAVSAVMVQKLKGISPGMLNIQSFWKHNVACGLASRAIAQNLGRGNLEAFYTAGMLHDIGFLIICQGSPKKAQEIMARCKFDDIPQSQAEEEVFGFSHAQVGALIFKEWGLAPSLIEAVRYHHDPSQAKEFPLESAVLHVADFFVYNIKFTVGENYTIPALDPKVIKLTGVTRDSLDYIRQAVNTQMAETLDIFTK